MDDLIPWFLSQGPQGIVVNGTTGEWFAQTVAERLAVAERARDLVPSQTPLLVGVNATLPTESVELAAAAASIGADGALVSLPPARRLGETDIEDYFKFISGTLRLPALVYNLPGYVGHDIPTHLLERILSLDNIVGIKDNTPSKDRKMQNLRTLGKDHAIFSDVLEPEAMQLFRKGYGRGQIGAAMPLGSRLSFVFDAVARGDQGSADVIVEEFSEFKREIVGAVGLGLPWHFYIKLIMRLSGVEAGYTRMPVKLPTSESPVAIRLRKVVQRYFQA
ncbi:dihydrodipicolinate synthetase [Alcanivorax marinus]|nr:dihydrodipicolinate synthetase [Alloalcanivorax marinus]